MKRIVRILLLTFMTLVSLSLVMAVTRPETGPIEKAVLGLGLVAILLAGVPVRRLN